MAENITDASGSDDTDALFDEDEIEVLLPELDQSERSQVAKDSAFGKLVAHGTLDAINGAFSRL